MLKKYREQGLVGITKTRSDKGKPRISEDWYQFILDTYKQVIKKVKELPATKSC